MRQTRHFVLEFEHAGIVNQNLVVWRFRDGTTYRTAFFRMQGGDQRPDVASRTTAMVDVADPFPGIGPIPHVARDQGTLTVPQSPIWVARKTGSTGTMPSPAVPMVSVARRRQALAGLAREAPAGGQIARTIGLLRNWTDLPVDRLTKSRTFPGWRPVPHRPLDRDRTVSRAPGLAEQR
jgi:hypothetical protein